MGSDQALCHPAFEFLRGRRIETLDVDMLEYQHRATGAMHFHLQANHPENVFMVALRTVPMDSTGVAHVLEHTALCGSERYPVRDPFFWMTRRSLNTFMNAFTTNDYTAYPFASQNRKDFFNLLDVYLDAVFFSRLDELDFAQEGCRLEFEDPDDPRTDLVWRGIVYNEMKGDSSAPVSRLFEALNAALYPTTTYHYNAGGDPAEIPRLGYEQLLAFYRTHYHPSNAVFMTFGNIPADEQQAVMEERALSRFDRMPGRIEVGREVRFSAPREFEETYALDRDADPGGKTHIVLGWLLGDNTNLDLLLRLNLLSDALLDTAGSPLRHALESSPLAAGLSPIAGLEETSFEMNFVVGVEGSDPEHAQAVEQLILETLARVAEEGIPAEQLEACLHQLELSQREIGGDSAPYGLQLIFSCMPAAIHRGDPIDLLDLDPAIERLRRDSADPDFIKRLVKEQLLDNPHRVRLVLKPDPAHDERVVAAEQARLAQLKDSLTPEAKQSLVDRAAALARRQASADDVSVLPKVSVKDIGVEREVLQPARSLNLGNISIDSWHAGTNGIVYHQIASKVPNLDPALMELLPLFANLVTEIGSGGDDYITTQRLQHGATGGINAWSAFRGSIDDPDALAGWFTLSSRTLNRQTRQMLELVKRTLTSPNFSERNRIRDLVTQSRMRREGGVTGSGHTLALSAAGAFFRAGPALQHHLSGLAGVRRLKALDRELASEAVLTGLIDRLIMISERIAAQRKALLLISDPAFAGEADPLLEELWQDQTASETAAGVGAAARPPRDQAWVTTTKVNFCAEVFPTVPESHPDAAALSVLAGVMQNTFLHSRLREQGGAYGGGATHDSASGLFRFYSYRDPNLMRTFDAFHEAINQALTAPLTMERVEEVVLGLIASIDAPSSPAGEARAAFHNGLFGRTPAHRKLVRRRLLDVTVDDLKRAAQDYLTGESARAVITGEAGAGTLPDSFEVVRL